MEHRLSARERLAFPIMLYQFSLPTLCGTSADVGPGGLFVRTGPVFWRVNECFDVELRGVHGRTFKVPAVVVHWRENGVGLMFSDMTDRQASELGNLLAAQRVALSCGVAA